MLMKIKYYLMLWMLVVTIFKLVMMHTKSTLIQSNLQGYQRLRR